MTGTILISSRSRVFTDAETKDEKKSQIQTANRALHLSLVLIFLIIAGCDSRKNVCPIDGQPPEGLWRKKGQSCEYFHYSVIEKKTHSWWAECTQESAQ